VRFVGVVYRAHNPRWAFDPLSGEGAARHGGRFNRPGLPALYLSTSIETAIREAAQGLIGKIDPLTIVSYEADVEHVVDLSTDESRRIADAPMEVLGCAWKLEAANRRPVATWELADRLIEGGTAGILAPSFARGATAADENLVLWQWGTEPPFRLAVHDPEGRLPANTSSWD
jgi:RES domain-containing protein